MKTTLSLLVTALVLVSAAAVAPEAIAKSPASIADGKLDAAMQTLQSGQQKIGRALDKKEFEIVLAQVVEMERAILDAKLEKPHTADAVKEADKKKEFLAGYRKQLIELQKALLDLEIAALDGKLDEAKKVFEERIKAVKKAGHDKYKGD